jgi:pSer/pThr/pTyr-binding forkhead associated (FHA) protein
MRLIRIGRDEMNEVRLNDPTVSRRHAELIMLDGGKLFLSDCNSTSGTFVFLNNNWEKVRQSYVGGDTKIRFGEFAIIASDLAAR